MNAMICRNCGAGLEADRIDTSLRIVTCSHCGSMHELSGGNFRHSGDRPQESEPTTPRPERKEVALPNKFTVHRAVGGIEITWPIGHAVQGLVLLVIAAGFAYVAITEGLYFLIAASVGIVYFGAVRTFNHHRVRTDSSSLQVTQGPLPWPGKRKLNVSDIDQLFSIEYETKQEIGNDTDRRVEIKKYYQLTARTRDNQQVKLLRGLSDPLQALWLEQEIEHSLGIRDKRVAGEHFV